METILGYVPQFMVDNSIVWGLVLYWLPLVICSVYFAKQFLLEYSADVKRREESGEFYVPLLTVGRVLGWILTTGIPVANLACAIFHAGPHLFHKFFKWLGRVFDFPLVPDSASAKLARMERQKAETARKKPQVLSDGPFAEKNPRS